MEPFKISCVTCQASLSVRNESLIGQIVSCPRCGSMVEIAPPASAAPEPTPIAAPAEIPAAAEDAAEELTTSSAQPNYQLMAWSAASFVVGALLVAAVMVSRRDAPADSPEAAVTPSPGLAARDVDESPSSDQPEQTIDEAPAPPVESPEPPADETTVAAEPVETEPTGKDIESPIADPITELAAEPVKVARRFDPLELDPTALDLATLTRASRNTAQTETGNPLIENDVESEPAAVVPDVPSTLPAVRLIASSNSEMTSRDAQSQLAAELPVLRVEAMPLIDFLRLVSNLAGVPVSVSPESLLMAGITARQKVSVEVRDVSLGEVLYTALEPLHLEFEAVGPHVIVTRQGGNTRRQIEYPIEDLISASFTGEQIAAWIEQLVLPTTWQSGTVRFATDSLQVDQTQRAHYQVLFFLERLRLAQGLKPRSRFPTKRLSARPASAAALRALDTPATFTFSHATALDEFFAHWQTELNLPILVDWPALAEADLWPTSQLTCAIANKPWSEALDAVLGPLGLGWRAVPGRAIEITSAEQIATELQLEIFPLSRDLGDALDELHALTASRADNPQPAALVFDPTHNLLLALQSAEAQRNLLRWLVERTFYEVD